MGPPRTTPASSGCRTTAPTRSGSPRTPTGPGPKSRRPPGSTWWCAPAGSTCTRPGASIDAADYRDAMDACGVGYEVLDATEARAAGRCSGSTGHHGRLPGRDRGWCGRAAANAAHRALAAANGATLLERSRVDRGGADRRRLHRGLRRGPGRRRPAHRRRRRLDQRVVAGLGWKVNLVVTQEQVAYFDAAPELGSIPVWIWMDDPAYYGLPVGRRVGDEDRPGRRRGQGRPARTARSTPTRHTAGGWSGSRSQLLPGTTGTIVEERTCLYTMTPDREFVLDRVPGHEGAFVGSAPPTGSSSPACSARCWPSSPSTGPPVTTSRAKLGLYEHQSAGAIQGIIQPGGGGAGACWTIRTNCSTCGS